MQAVPREVELTTAEKKSIMKIINFCVLAFMIALSGCAALKYNVALEQPTEGSRARVRVVIPTVFNHSLVVRAFPNRDCAPNLNSPNSGNVVAHQPLGFVASWTGQKLGIPETPLSAKEHTKQAEVFVIADQPIVFFYFAPVMGYGGTTRIGTTHFIKTYGCNFPISFVPEAGTDYELEFAYNPSKNICTASLHKLGTPNSKNGMVPIQMERVDKCKR
jgi:hypothetical protein